MPKKKKAGIVSDTGFLNGVPTNIRYCFRSFTLEINRLSAAGIDAFVLKTQSRASLNLTNTTANEESHEIRLKVTPLQINATQKTGHDEDGPDGAPE